MQNIIVALKCEAKPLIAHYGLKHVPGKPLFPVYEKDDIVLTITGPGKIASAAATAFIHTLLGQQANAGWLNPGIAGHKNRSIGQGVLVHKITDKSSGRNCYPSIVFLSACESENLITVDKTENEYSESAVYDMEAAGFYATASRFSTAELIHCYKVISDNEACPTSSITEDSVKQLITAKLEEIDNILQEIKKLSTLLQSLDSMPLDYEEINDRWHFSVYQKGELRRLLKRWDNITANENPLISQIEHCKTGKSILSFLEKRVVEFAISKTL